MTSAADKATVRAAVRARRSLRDAAEQHALGDQIARHALTVLPSRRCTVTAYRSLPGEPATGALIAALLDRGDRLLLPRITGRFLEWVEVTSQTDFAPGPLGISEPVGLPLADDALQDADVLFIPGLGVDRQGWRLGQGGGFYDTALATVPQRAAGGPLRVAILHDDERFDDIPHDYHDCRVDVVVTPSGVHPVAG